MMIIQLIVTWGGLEWVCLKLNTEQPQNKLFKLRRSTFIHLILFFWTLTLHLNVCPTCTNKANTITPVEAGEVSSSHSQSQSQWAEAYYTLCVIGFCSEWLSEWRSESLTEAWQVIDSQNNNKIQIALMLVILPEQNPWLRKVWMTFNQILNLIKSSVGLSHDGGIVKWGSLGHGARWVRASKTMFN
jgi:hypothetical protein